MWRYILASLAIGFFVSLVVLAFYEAGVFPWIAAHLQRFYDAFAATELPVGASPIWLLQYAVVVAAAFGLGWVAVDMAGGSRKLIVALGAVLIIALASPVLALYGILFEPVSGSIAAAAAYVAGLLYSRGEGAKRKRLFRELFVGRVSEGVLADLARSPFRVKFNGESRPVSILVCRVLNHAELRGNLRARDAIELSNYFIESAAEFLRERGGYLDETMPDGLRVCFGVPLADEDHAAAACRAALGLREHLEGLARECEARWLERVEWGIGLASGEMTVGHFGVGRFAHFSALGPEADLARRLCGANRHYGSAVLASSTSYAMAGDAMLFRPMDMLFDPEPKVVVEVYELVAEAGGLGAEEDARREAFWRGVVRLRSGNWAAALEEFGNARPPDATDRPVEHYIGRVQERILAGEGEPEPAAGVKADPLEAAKL